MIAPSVFVLQTWFVPRDEGHVYAIELVPDREPNAPILRVETTDLALYYCALAVEGLDVRVRVEYSRVDHGARSSFRLDSLTPTPEVHHARP